MTDEQIGYMVGRFLNWKLPDNFNPDGGVTFQQFSNQGTPHEYRFNPVGTNILNAVQATAMVLHMVEGLPEPKTRSELIDDASYADLIASGGLPEASVFTKPE